MLNRTEARRYYDWFGARQDRQAFYEDAALSLLVERGGFAGARSVVEFGCGTGRFAEMLLRHHLDSGATYRGFDQSATMVGLARDRVALFELRAKIVHTGGSMELDLPTGSCDRFVANYVLEILSRSDQEELVEEAHRLLEPGGRLCIAAITPGCSLVSQAVMGLWKAAHVVRARSVGGCQPIVGRDLVADTRWEIESRQVLSRWGIASEVLVASRKESK